MRADAKTVRLGGGSAGAEDRIDPALDLAESGSIDYLIFDSLSESELSLIASARRSDPSVPGYDVFTEVRLNAVMPACARNGVKIIGNMGAADPEGAQNLAVGIARRLGLTGMRIAAVSGDNVLGLAQALNLKVAETGRSVNAFGDDLVSAYAYISGDPIVAALQDDADVVITGRVGDASLFLAPLVHEFGWPADDWDRRARGIVIGHLLECAAQVTGGFFADPPYKVVPDLDRLGFPIAEVTRDGGAVITKLADAGGLVSPATCAEQLLYEVHDPANYIEADVISDFSGIVFENDGRDRVRIAGEIRGKPKPRELKVSLGVREGWLGAGTVYYGGPGALDRAKLAAEAVTRRFERLGLRPSDLKVNFLGVDGLFGSAPDVPASDPWEVGLRIAGRAEDRTGAAMIAREASTVLSNNGPAGVSCRQRQYELKEIVGYYTTFIPREAVTPKVNVKES